MDADGMQAIIDVKNNGMRFLVILFISFLGLTFAQGFMTPSIGLEPVKPYDALGFDVEVENLQPEFQWKASEFDGSTYDFAIWKANPDRHSAGKQSWGELVYYVEGLKSNRHAIDIILLPNTVYCWSVRERRMKDNHLGAWSNRSLAGITEQRKNTPYYFKTPRNAKIPDLKQWGRC